MNSYEVVIIGAGHNGLVCGAYLAKAGLKVCVLERRSLIGGASVTEEIWPGYRVSTAAHMMGLLQPRVILDLELQKFGYEIIPTPPIVHHIDSAGPIPVWREPDKLAAEFARLSQRDAAAYPAFAAHLARLGPIFQKLLWEIPFDPSSLSPGNLMDVALFAWRNRGMVGAFYDVSDLITMSVYDYLSRWFESDAVKMILGYYPVGGSGQSVSFHTPGTAYFLLRNHLRDNTTAAGGTGLVRGGMGNICEAIAKSGARFGMEVRVDAEVSRILVKDGRAQGVVLVNGDEIRARTVISNASARHTFLSLVEEGTLPCEFLRDIRSFKGQSTAFKIHLAVDELPHYPDLGKAGLGNTYPVQICIAPSIAYVEKAYLDMREGRVSRRPYLTVQAPTVVDPSLAPKSRHILSIYGGHVPSGPGADHGAATRETVYNAAFDAIAQFAPNLPRHAVHRQILLASDYEEIFGLPGGNPHHADLTLNQVFFRRPARRYADYRSPIAGLFLSSASTHPGGAVTGVPGYNAARVVLKMLRSPA
ncbi:MAG: NAD(P)/FAD-dependent oxidoreductase [Rhizobiales bacterium]|nr:NAD(P)/FAD-dependent oxidoreductase [Hyphomicrobiales bacterium]